MTGYELSRNWFDWCFENPEKINPNHTALYFFCCEHKNRMGGKEKFGLPTTMAKEAIGIKSYNTYINTLNDLVDFGFIILIEKSKNQYSSNIIALSNFNKAVNKALDKALIKHATKQVKSIDSIDKQDNNKQETSKSAIPSFFDFLTYAKTLNGFHEQLENPIKTKYDSWVANDWKDGNDKKITNWKSKLINTMPYIVTANPISKSTFKYPFPR